MHNSSKNRLLQQCLDGCYFQLPFKTPHRAQGPCILETNYFFFDELSLSPQNCLCQFCINGKGYKALAKQCNFSHSKIRQTVIKDVTRTSRIEKPHSGKPIFLINKQKDTLFKAN